MIGEGSSWWCGQCYVCRCRVLFCDTVPSPCFLCELTSLTPLCYLCPQLFCCLCPQCWPLMLEERLYTRIVQTVLLHTHQASASLFATRTHYKHTQSGACAAPHTQAALDCSCTTKHAVHIHTQTLQTKSGLGPSNCSLTLSRSNAGACDCEQGQAEKTSWKL